MATVVRNPPRAAPEIVAGLAALGVATVHEAQERRGLLADRVRPIVAGMRVAGTAVTVSTPPGDNWMIHVAIEQCQAGDLLVVAPTSPCTDGYVGELIATALQSRGAVGIVIDAGCRDVAELRAMNFPVWSSAVSAQGTVKESLGDVNRPVVCAGQYVEAGDVMIADDDGVVVVSRQGSMDVLARSTERAAREEALRARYRKGEISLDVGRMRPRLAEKGLVYIEAEPDGA